jgi:formamidopyrimidine-DNA glycosylase
MPELPEVEALRVFLTTELDQVAGIASLGPDPLAEDFSFEVLESILTAAGKSQLKGVLRDQRVLAGIGNAYSDEILHAVKLSPFKPANGLSRADQVQSYTAIRTELSRAVDRGF